MTTPSTLRETFCKATSMTQGANTKMPPLSVAWRIYVPNMLCIATITFYLSLRRGPDWLLRAESPSQTHNAQLLNQSVDETTESGVHHDNLSEAFETTRKKGFIAPVSKPCLLISLLTVQRDSKRLLLFKHGAMVAVQILDMTKWLCNCPVLGCWCHHHATDATDASAFCPVFCAVLLRMPATA